MVVAGAHFAADLAERAPVATPYPVWYDVAAQTKSRRLTVAFRAVLAIPHLFVLSVLGPIAYLVTIVGWLSIVFSARYDASLASFPLMYLRWLARVYGYIALLRDEYPPFGSGSYPVLFEVSYQDRRSRLRTFFRLPLLLPQYVVLYFLFVVWSAAVALAWFAILLSGAYPEGLRRLVVGLTRWLLRVFAYALLLRDEYPPFSLALDERLPAWLLASAPPYVPALEPLPSTPAYVESEVPAPSEPAEAGETTGFFAFPPSRGPAPSTTPEPDSPEPPSESPSE
ncbi:MAG: DUF4389 domain-containing protein [Dehalococcoidia bacterium]